MMGSAAAAHPVPASAAQAAGAPASAPYYAPPPGSDVAAENYAGAQAAYNRALIRFNQQRTGLLRQYGYKGTVDPTTGMVTNVGVDTGNSYGALQTLLHNQALEDQNADYAAQDRGLVGGLANQGESELAYQHHGQTTDLANQLFGSLSDLNTQQQDAQDTLDQALWQLQHDATTQAVDGGQYDPAAPPSATTTDPNTSPPGGQSPNGNRVVGTPKQIAAASLAAYKRAGGKSSPGSALAARSAGMNAAYGLASKAAQRRSSSPAKSAYLTNKNKKG